MKTSHAAEELPIWVSDTYTKPLSVGRVTLMPAQWMALNIAATELLALYDLRPELAKAEADPHVDQKWLKKQLREYGERKKAGWIALRAALEVIP